MYAKVNPHNFWPVFTQEQLATSLQASTLINMVLCGAITIDINKLHNDIRSTYVSDLISSAQLPIPSNPKWSLSAKGFLLPNDWIYVPDYGLQIL